MSYEEIVALAKLDADLIDEVDRAEAHAGKPRECDCFYCIEMKGKERWE